MSGKTLTDWVYDLATSYGFDSGTCEAPVRPPEMISGASGVQVSTGENTDQSAEEGGDFAEKSRENAEANDHSEAYSSYDDGSNPMQSPSLGKSSDFTLRYGVGFLCADYPGNNNDLDDIADYSKPKSAYLAAFRGMNKTKQYKNPTASQIVAGIQTWVLKLAKDLKGCGQGELVVSFQGHGWDGSFFGVDDKEITSSKLLAIANKAAKVRVSITYIMDACYSGNAVQEFQDNAADHVDKQIDKAGANAVSSDQAEQVDALKNQMAHARELIRVSHYVGRLGTRLSNATDAIEQNNTEAAWNSAIQVNQLIIRTIEVLYQQFETNMDFGTTPEMRIDAIDAEFQSTLEYLRGVEPFTCFDYSEWTGVVGNFQDVVSDGANRIIKLVKKELDALK